MDAIQFDILTRSLADTRSRRRVLLAAHAGALGLLGWHAVDDAAAHDPSQACKKKSGKAKKKCLKKAKTHNATHTSEPATPLPPPPEPTCSDNVKNGSESDVDCGGSCPQCGAGLTCASRTDCRSNVCTAGRCQKCSETTCGTDCSCRQSKSDGIFACTVDSGTGAATNCACSDGEVCIDIGGGSVECFKLCSAA